MEKLRVLSLFDGISCGMVALERAGFDVVKYDAYEVDENPILVSKDNYPKIVQKGNVFDGVFYEGQYDMLIGGSPCTHWSIAKAGGNRETTSSGFGWELFMQYVRALRESKPKWFLYENNFSMSDDIKIEITKQLGVEPIMIDSADFSAQSRKRYYWTNIPFNNDYSKSKLVVKDIMYNHDDYAVRDFYKYKDTVKWNKDKTICSWDTSGKGYYSQCNRCRVVEIKSNTVLASGDDKVKIYLGEYKCRKLHPIEAERLQTLPDGYTSCLKSKSKRIGVVGNGWTVDVIAHIFKGIKKIK